MQESPVMSMVEKIGSTNYELLRLLRNFDEQFAWSQFLDIYNPMIRNFCCDRDLKPNEVDEVLSLVYSRLVAFFSKSDLRIHTTFRGFLAKVIENEINGFLKRKKLDQWIPLDDIATNAEPYELSKYDREKLDELEISLSGRLVFIAMVIETVRTHVSERTWEIFWDYAVLNHSVGEVASRYDVSKSTVFKYRHRVSNMAEKVANKKSHG